MASLSLTILFNFKIALFSSTMAVKVGIKTDMLDCESVALFCSKGINIGMKYFNVLILFRMGEGGKKLPTPPPPPPLPVFLL